MAITAESQFPKVWEVTFPNVYGLGCMAQVTAALFTGLQATDDSDTMHLPDMTAAQ
ncbi:hypothetical protein EDB85DRAFT_2159143 [Lactarius pseudohatsudake]|nr:hypothetical protein EDB85DRAFT_2159143 [Lactarius pseudohatsudake]